MPVSKAGSTPGPQGLYDPAYEHDACGVGAVANTRGVAGHAIVRDALVVLHNLDHRGAAGSEPTSGDGAGIMLQVPDALLRATVDFALPEPRPSSDGGAPVLAYATGLAFLPADPDDRAKAVSLLERIVAEEGLDVLGWREVPVDPEGADVGSVARGAMPHFAQIVVATPDRQVAGIELDRLAWIVRKRAERQSAEEGCGLYIASLSSRTMTYKGMLTTDQLPVFFPDLRDERLVSAIAVVHSRFSTNTFPSWPLAHPYRVMAHNGEINTIRGNRNRMRAREALLATDLFPGDLQRAMPVCPEDVSDSASFDEVLELLELGGRPLPHAVMMMMPEAWENHAEMPTDQRDFYRFHASLMEPWDGPACVTFTDGTLMGATLDRNGLRPARWWHLDDDRVVLASESGVLDVDPSRVLAKGRLRPGRMFLVDTRGTGIVDDDAFKSELAAEAPYGEWLHAGLVHLDDLPAARAHRAHPRVGRPPAADLRLHRGGPAGPPRADGHHRRGAARVDGHRHPHRGPVGALPAALRLLRPAVRAGDEPAARRDPRGARHLDDAGDRAGAEPVPPRPRLVPAGRAARPGDRQRRPRQAHPHRRRRRHARVRRDGDLRALRGRRRRAGPGRRARPRAPPGVRGDRRRQEHPRALRPRLRRAVGADPGAAAGLGGAPPPRRHPRAHPGRPGRRVRRRPRGAPHRAAARLRRRGGQPVPGLRVDRRHDHATGGCRTSSARRPSTTT